MVHALNEVRRVLSPGGLMIDLRPLLDRWPLEVSWPNGFHEAGRATDVEQGRLDDLAAEAAMAQAAADGGFERQRSDAFSFFYYWDSPREMQAYIAEEWDDVVSIEDDVWNALRSSWASAGAEARVRLRLKLTITRYRKQD